MLIRIQDSYFSWEFQRIDDVLVSLAAGAPFTAYPGATLVRSDGQTSHVSLDGRTASLSNAALAEVLRLAREQQVFPCEGPSP